MDVWIWFCISPHLGRRLAWAVPGGAACLCGAGARGADRGHRPGAASAHRPAGVPRGGAPPRRRTAAAMRAARATARETDRGRGASVTL